MDYEIKRKITLNEGDFVEVTEDLTFFVFELLQGQILKIVKVESHQIRFLEFFALDGAETEYRYIMHTIGNSPGEQVQFEHFLESLEYVKTQKLYERNIPIDEWSQRHLLNYIEFLRDQINDLEAENNKTLIVHNDIIEIIEFLNSLGDGSNDDLGKLCERHSKVLKKLLTLI